MKFFFCTHHLETRDICFFTNKIYSSKRMAPNNKWKILTPLKFFYTVTIRWSSSQRIVTNSYQICIMWLRNNASSKHKPLALEVFCRWLSTLGLKFNQWQSWWYFMYMINWFRCVQAIEADPLNRTKHFVSRDHHYISPAPHPTGPQTAGFSTSAATKINIYISGSCDNSCDTSAVYYSSISEQKQALSQSIFNSSTKS